MTDPSLEPTAVTATAPMRRSFGADLFADLTRPDVSMVGHAITSQVAADRTKIWDITFEGTEPGPALDDTTAEAIRLRMESTDDVDQARRAGLRADRDALEPGAPLRRLYDYVLGD